MLLWQTSIYQSPCSNLIKESNWLLACVTYSFHEGQTLWLTATPGTLWNGKNSAKNPKERAWEGMPDAQKWQPSHPSQLSLSLLSSHSSQSPRSSFVGLLRSTCAHGTIFPDHPARQNGRFLSTKGSTLRAFGDSSLLSSHLSGSHSSWCCFFLVRR